MENLLEFAHDLIRANDGDVEWHESRRSFDALVSEEVQDRLGIPDTLVTILDGASADEAPPGIPIGFGTELLERAIPMAIETGKTASVRMPLPPARKRPELNPGSFFTFPNAAFKVKGEREGLLDYWIWSFDLSADADERRQEVHHVAVSSRGAGSADLPALILDQAGKWEPLKVKESEFSEETLNRLFTVACDRLLGMIDESLAGFRESVARHHGRDIQRIETYFQDMVNEMEEEIRRRRLSGSELEIRREKMGQLAQEKSRKLSALKEKYRIRLTLRPLTLLLARLPVRYCDILVKRRKGERRITAAYNMLKKGFDPMVCDACGADTHAPGFCDDALHLLCRSCMSVYLKEKTCPRCRGRRPPSKVEEVLRRAGIRPRAGKQT